VYFSLGLICIKYIASLCSMKLAMVPCSHCADTFNEDKFQITQGEYKLDTKPKVYL
jgi:hypothetical protein